MQEKALPALVVSDEKSNITDLLLARAAKTPNLALFANKDGDSFKDVTADEFLTEVRAVAKGLIAIGIQSSQAVAIMSRTRYEWSLLDFAVWFAGGVSVPVYETSSASQLEWILSNSDSVALFYESEEHAERFEQIKHSVPLTQTVLHLDEATLKDLKIRGKEITDNQLEQRRTLAQLGDLATIIYTSGTTGKPKGCELTHRGFVELSKNATLDLADVVVEGRGTVLFLPLAHVFARFVEVLCVHGGIRVTHEPDARLVGQTLEAAKPEFLLAVPRVFEKVYNSAEQKAESGGKGEIFRTAAQAAIAWSEAKEHGHVPFKLSIMHFVFDKLVYSKLRKAMGGRLQYAISGGAPLGARLGHFFRAVGVIVLEGYGLTETTAPATISRPQSARIGKVGLPLPGTAIRIADDGEVLAKGHHIMRGYWRNDAATHEVLHDGWFSTGDIGSLDADGFLSITGRKKELLITAAGKNVAPAVLEDPLRAHPLIGQAVVIGDQKPFVSAIISLDSEMLPIWLANHGGDSTMTIQQAAKSPLVLEAVQSAVDQVNDNVSRAESIRKFEVIDSELTEASGHLTPSLKIKRNAVLADFAKVVDRIYSAKQND
ncbi:MAG: AMP-dependent synthetase/ligase [Micrococcales bacterium]